MIKLSCGSQKYPWGKPAATSLVAKLTGKTDDGNIPYAELWMGTHPKCPSLVAETGQLLMGWAAEEPEVRLGDLCDSGTLPFLLKVLSVNKALSIQAHPTKERAAVLHAAHPEHYPDPNHKPEMAIALTVFEGLCGFRPMSTIRENLMLHDELHDQLSAGVVKQIKGEDDQLSADFLKTLFRELITMENSAALILDKINRCTSSNESDKLFLRIHADHPGDSGLVCIYLLNHVTLQPGEAMFLGANKIHAYFSGDCIECMACSDNVVRAGLTGKFVDVETLVDMLDYTPGTAESQKLAGVRGAGRELFLPPVPDFAVEKVHCEGSSVVGAKRSPQIAICTGGAGRVSAGGTPRMEVKEGDVVYVIPNMEVRVEGELTLFFAFTQDLSR